MKSSFAALAALAVIPGILGLTINTPPSAVQCQPLLLTWADGARPYYVAIIPGGQPSATPLVDFGQLEGTSYTWNVNLPGTSMVTAQVKDSTGQIAYTEQFPINNADATCASSSGASSGSSTPSSSSSSSSSVVNPPISGTSTPVSGTTTPLSASSTPVSGSISHSSSVSRSSASGSATSAAAGAASPSNAAGRIDGNAFGLAGLLGLIGSALF